MPDDTKRAPSLDGRIFVGFANSADGQVDSATRFTYHEAGDRVEAEYAGGAIVRGWLVGVRDGDTLSFRYLHIGTDRQTASGRCNSRIEVLPDGRMRLHESWAWESRAGSGTSIVEEVRADDA